MQQSGPAGNVKWLRRNLFIGGNDAVRFLLQRSHCFQIAFLSLWYETYESRPLLSGTDFVLDSVGAGLFVDISVKGKIRDR